MTPPLLVLAGGFGTRLQSAVADVPKALAPVGSVPFLHLQIEHWKKQNVRSYIFLLHHQADLIIGFLQKEQETGLLAGCDVHYLVEPTPMGTGGAVAYAVEQRRLAGSFLVTNADTWLGTGIVEVSQSSAPAMAIVERRDAARYGLVQVDLQQRVTAFREKSHNHGGGWINAGLYQLNAASFQNWDHLPFSLERLVLPAMVVTGKLQAIALRTDFIDIGVPEDYLRFCRWIAAGRQGDLCN